MNIISEILEKRIKQIILSSGQIKHPVTYTRTELVSLISQELDQDLTISNFKFVEVEMPIILNSLTRDFSFTVSNGGIVSITYTIESIILKTSEFLSELGIDKSSIYEQDLESFRSTLALKVTEAVERYIKKSLHSRKFETNQILWGYRID